MWETLANNPADYAWDEWDERDFRNYEHNWNAQEVMAWFSCLDWHDMTICLSILEDYVAEDEKLLDC